MRQFPLLANVNVVRTWSAIRVMTQDGFPIYDESETHPGAFTVCCHSGVTLCRQSRAHDRADDRPRRPRQVAGRSLQRAEVPCSRGWLTPGAPVAITVDGKAISARTGDTVAAALLAAGIDHCRTTPVTGAPRAPYCLMGVCFDCLVTIDGVGSRQACLVPVRDGMAIETQLGKREAGR